MGAIAFSTRPEENWVVAGWAFRQILDDVAVCYPQDSEMAKEFEEAKAISGLIVYKLRSDLAVRVTTAIKTVANGILAGAIRSGIRNQPYGDDSTIAEYMKGLRELLETIPLQK